jgi:hypothetical protein
VAVRSSKQALARAADLLGTDTASAREHLRRIQRIVGPVPYETIVAAMARKDDRSVETVARSLAAEPPTDPANGR